MKLLITLFFKSELGGLHDNVKATAIEANRRGHDVYVACKEGPFLSNIREHGIIGIPINYDDINSSVSTIIEQAGTDIDLIHAHPGISRKIAIFIHREFNIPVIYHVHGAWLDNIRFYINEVSCVFTVSNASRQKVIDVCGGYEHKVHILHNYSDYEQESPMLFNLEAETKIVSLITRIDEDKKFITEQFIKLIPLFNEQVNNVKIQIIGQGTLKQEFLNILNSKINNKNVIVKDLGWISDKKELKRIIKESFIVVGPGRVAIDSLTLGKATIVIGSENYLGYISKDNWQEHMSCNFGGYGNVNNSSSIIKDFEMLFNDEETYNESVNVGNQVVKEFFDKESIISKQNAIYNLSKSE